jgi:hypothetical protein
MNPYQTVISETLNRKLHQQRDDKPVIDFADYLAAKFEFDSNMSSREVLVREDLPYVVKIDLDSIYDGYSQNHNEWKIHQQIKTEAPQFAKLLPKIYWLSPCKRIMLVQKIPFEVCGSEMSRVQRLHGDFLDWLEHKTKLDMSEVEDKDCSWRKDANCNYFLVDAGSYW